MSKIRLTDESVNKYGFRVVTSGIDLTEFRKNPVMFFGHEEWGLPIGKWEDIEVIGGQILARPVFDETDQFAMKVKNKWDQGMINAASIGFEIMERDDNSRQMMPGQTRPTVTKSRMREASLVSVPANSNSYKLYFENNNSIRLSDGMPENTLNELLPKTRNMKNIAIKLGLAEDATEEQILAALAAVQLAAPQLAAPGSEAETTQSEADGNAVEAIVALGESKGLDAARIRPLAKADATAALSFVRDYAAPTKPIETKPALSVAELIALAQKGGKPAEQKAGRETWKFNDWRKNDPNGLKKLQLGAPESAERQQFDALQAAHMDGLKEKAPQWFQPG